MFTLKVSFVATVGSGSRGDIAIDDIHLKEHGSIGENNCLLSPSCARPPGVVSNPNGKIDRNCTSLCNFFVAFRIIHTAVYIPVLAHSSYVSNEGSCACFKKEIEHRE